MPPLKKYLRIIISAPVNLREQMIAFLDSFSVNSFEENESGQTIDITFYRELSVEVESLPDKILNEIEAKNLGFQLDYEKVSDEYWEKIYHDQVKKIRIGSFIIKPPWKEMEKQNDYREIIIEPGMAFGTGLHPTTQQSILALEIDTRKEDLVLDIGTGSGILAFVAMRLGASKTIGLDVDAEAINLARRNAAHNNLLEKIEFLVKDWEDLVPFTADIIVANITASQSHKIIESLMVQKLNCRNIILSGFYQDERISIEKALQAAGFYLLEGFEKENWVTVRAISE